MLLAQNRLLVLLVALAGNAVASAISGAYTVGCLAGTGGPSCVAGIFTSSLTA